MWEDPIVAEVHRAREKLAAEYKYRPRGVFRRCSKTSGDPGQQACAA